MNDKFETLGEFITTHNTVKELASIIEKLSPKNLERLLWCAQGLMTNKTQKEFAKSETEGK